MSNVQVAAHLEEAFPLAVGPHEGVIDSSDMVREVLGDSIVPLIIPVTADHVPLWCYPVPVSTSLSKKGCVVAVVRVEGNLVVDIPSVHYTLLGLGRDLGCELEWGRFGVRSVC